MGKGIGWGHLGNYKNYRVVGAKKEEEKPLSIEERQQQVFNKFNKSWEYDPEKLKPAFGWLGAPLQTGSTPSVSVTPTPTPSVTPTMTPTPSATPTPQFSPSGITGLQLWFDADDTSTLSTSGNLVESWTSKGSTPLVLTATTTTRRPEYITTGGTGSSSAVLFFSSATAANRSLLTQQDTSQSFNLTSGHTIFMAQKNIGSKSATGTIGSFATYFYTYGSTTPAVNQNITFAMNTNISEQFRTGATTGYFLQYSSPGIITPYYWSGTSYSIKYASLDYTDMGPTKIYGQDIYSGSVVNTQTTNTFVTSYTGKTINGMGIGGFNYAGTPQGVLSSPNEVYEILVYDRKLSTNEANQVMDYLRTKWDYVVDTSNLAIFDVNYTGKTNNTNDYFLLTSNTSPLNTIGNSYFGGQGMKYILGGGVDAFFNAQFLTSNLGANYIIRDSGNNIVESATCRKTSTTPITYSAGTYSIEMDLDYNCIDPSPTPTLTLTPTYTPSPTPTFTMTPSYTPTFTPTPSATPPTPVSVSYVGGNASTTNTTTYTFSSVSTGAGLVVVGIAGARGSGSAISSVTIGGVSATFVQNTTSSGSLGGNIYQGLVYAVVTGSTNTIVVNFSSGVQNCQITYWLVSNYTSSTPVYSGGTTSSNSSGLSLTTSSLNGTNIGIALSILGVANTTQTWTNATERYDGTIESGSPSVSGADFTTSSSGTRQVDTSHASNGYGEILQMAVWN